MSLRPSDLLDRAAVLAAGIVAMAAGLAGVAWPNDLVPNAPERLDTEPVIRAATTSWWPWALAGSGTLLLLIALAWIIWHVPIRTAPALRMAGAAAPGVITINLDGIASAAASALEQESNIQSAKGKAIIDRGMSTIELTVTVTHPAGLSSAISAVDATCGHIARATAGAGSRSVAARTLVQLAKVKNVR